VKKKKNFFPHISSSHSSAVLLLLLLRQQDSLFSPAIGHAQKQQQQLPPPPPPPQQQQPQQTSSFFSGTDSSRTPRSSTSSSPSSSRSTSFHATVPESELLYHQMGLLSVDKSGPYYGINRSVSLISDLISQRPHRRQRGACLHDGRHHHHHHDNDHDHSDSLHRRAWIRAPAPSGVVVGECATATTSDPFTPLSATAAAATAAAATAAAAEGTCRPAIVALYIFFYNYLLFVFNVI